MACGMEKLSVQRCDKIYGPQGPQSHSMPQIWCQPLDVPCSQSTRTAKEAKHESSEVICIFSYFFVYRVSWNRLRFCRVAFCKFSRAIVIPSALRRIWRSDIAASGKVTSASWTWPTTQFQWLKTITYTMEIHGPFMIIYVHPLSTNAISISSFAVLRLILTLRPEGQANPGAFCRPKISNAVAAKVYWTTHIKPSICVMASGAQSELLSSHDRPTSL